MPAASRAARIASRVLSCGSVAPRSKSAIVERAKPSTSASFGCDQPSKERAARHCSGNIVMAFLIANNCLTGRGCADINY